MNRRVKFTSERFRRFIYCRPNVMEGQMNFLRLSGTGYFGRMKYYSPGNEMPVHIDFLSTQLVLVCTLMMVMTCSGLCQIKDTLTGSVLIVNGRMVDGSGSSSRKADILLEGDIIHWIGDAGDVEISADKVFDAGGKVVAPGFIDLHAHGSPLETPAFENFLAMGVTTIALGMDGSSQKSSALDQWFEAIRKVRPGVHILPFIGHGTLRSESGIGTGQDPGSTHLDQLLKLCEKALKQGCWGLSLGLEYQPGRYAKEPELVALAKLVGRYDRLITSHIRNEDDDRLDQSIVEMTRLSKHCRVNISHIKSVYGRGEERAAEITSLLKADPGFGITADLYPYTASYTGIGIVFPDWAKRPKTYESIKKTRGEELARYLRDKVAQRNGPAATLLGNGPYKGKTLASVAEEYKMPYELVLRDIIGPYGTSAAYFVMDEDLQRKLAADPVVMIGSDGSPTMYHPRGYGTFAKVIQSYVVKDSVVSLEEAIRKMTSLPASTLGLHDRGRIAAGMKADLVVFDPNEVQAHASFDDPHRLSTGFTWVFVNGMVVYDQGSFTGRAGELLLAPQH